MDNNNEFSYNAAPEKGTNENSASREDSYGASESRSGVCSWQHIYGTDDSTANTNDRRNEQTSYSEPENIDVRKSEQASYGSTGRLNNRENPYGSSGWQQNQNPYRQSSPYQSPYGNANQNAYRAAMEAPGQEDFRREAAGPTAHHEKKSGGFGATLGKCAAIAVIFGLVGGGIFTGVSYAGMRALGVSSSVSADADTSAAASGSSQTGTTQTYAPVESTSTGTAKDIESVSDIVDEVMPGIVAITNTSVVTYQSFFGGTQQYESESCGSGILVRQDSEYLYIVTNNHVVSGAETLSVQFCNDVAVDGEILGTYAASDLAVVKVALSSVDSDTLAQIKLVTIGDSDSLRVGEGTVAIGNALGYGQSVTTGIVSALNRSITVQDETTGTTTTCSNLIQTDAAINPGNSGGALLDSTGALIGINSAKYADTDVEGIGYAIPINSAIEVVDKLIAGESLEKTQTAYLGIAGGDVSSDVASTYGLPQGVYVKSVYEGSGAEAAGICQGDIITGLDGTDLTSMTELQTMLMDYSAGDTVTLTVWRMNNGYQSMEVSVTLSDASVIGSDTTGSSGSGSDDSGSGYGYGGGSDGGSHDGSHDYEYEFGFGW